MTRVRTLIVLALATAAVVAGALATREEPVTIPEAGKPLFPDLLARVNEVAEVELVGDGERVTVARRGDDWVLAGKSGYPADPAKVRELALGLAELERVEPKTRNPDLYPRLGLDDPERAGSQAVRYTLEDTGGEPLASVDIGTRRAGRTDAELSELYVRLSGERRTWLVEGRLPRVRTALDLVDDTLTAIELDRVREVSVEHAGGERVVVRRGAPGEDFSLLELPEGHRVARQWAVDDVARALSDLRFEDVRAAGEAGGTPAFNAELTTFDGLRVRLEAVRMEEAVFARLEAAFDETLATAPPAAAGGAQRRDDEAASASPAGVREEAERLGERWSGWAFALPRHRIDMLGKRMDELVEPVEETGEAAEETGAPATGGAGG